MKLPDPQDQLPRLSQEVKDMNGKSTRRLNECLDALTDLLDDDREESREEPQISPDSPPDAK
jgi:hypothetical protein